MLGRTTRRTTPAGDARGSRRLFGLAVELGEDGLDRTDGEGSVTKASASRIPPASPPH